MRYLVVLFVVVLWGCEKPNPPLSHIDLSHVAKEARSLVKGMKIEEDSICKLRNKNIQTDIDSLMEVKRQIINKKIRAAQNKNQN